MLTPPTFDHIGPGFLENAPDACAPGPRDEHRRDPAVPARLHRRRARRDDWSAALCWNMVVPPEVRGALISREIDGTDVLRSASVPVLVTHGRDDQIVLPSMAEHVLGVCEQAVASWYDGVGHMPFWEAAERFDRGARRTRRPGLERRHPGGGIETGGVIMGDPLGTMPAACGEPGVKRLALEGDRHDVRRRSCRLT